jgi:hypothetical protein
LFHKKHIASDLLWSANYATNDGPLIEFCRQALELTKLRDMCTRAIKAETIATQHKVIASSMMEGAAGT